MEGTCVSCARTISGSDMLYTAAGALVCPACFDKADLAATIQRKPAPWALVYIGAIVGLIPLLVRMGSATVITIDGAVVEESYRDWVAIGGGFVALGCGLVAAGLSLSSRPITQQLGLAVAVLALGAFQLMRGFGQF